MDKLTRDFAKLKYVGIQGGRGFEPIINYTPEAKLLFIEIESTKDRRKMNQIDDPYVSVPISEFKRELEILEKKILTIDTSNTEEVVRLSEQYSAMAPAKNMLKFFLRNDRNC